MEFSYKTIEFTLHECLVQLQNILTMLDADRELLLCINRNKEILATKRYRVAVMGEFKRGKSSLINALLGNEILPADVEPATATINRITFGGQLRSEVHFKDGSSKAIDVTELSDYVTKLTPEGASRADKIREAVVYAPSVICQNYVDIIDTPGLNDSGTMTRVSIEMLEEIDAVIVAIHAKIPFGQTEGDFVAQLMRSPNIHSVLFVVTFLDMLDEDDYEYEYFIERIKKRIRSDVFRRLESSLDQVTEDGRREAQAHLKKAHQLLDEPYVFGLSAAQALKYFTTNNQELLKKSRFYEFKNELMQIITAKQVENACLYTLNEIRFLMKQIPHIYDSKMSIMHQSINEMDAQVQRVEMFLEHADNMFEKMFISKIDEIQNVIYMLNGCKNTVVSAFIQDLSALKELNHAELYKLLQKNSQIQSHYVSEYYTTMLRPKLSSIVSNIQSDMIAIFQKNLSQELFASDKQANKDLQTVIGVFAQIFCEEAVFDFEWTSSPVPTTADLCNYNIIEHVIVATDVSFNSYISTLVKKIDDTRIKTGELFKQYVKNQSETVRASKVAQRYTLQTYIKTYERNYSQFKATLHDINTATDEIAAHLLDSL